MVTIIDDGIPAETTYVEGTWDIGAMFLSGGGNFNTYQLFAHIWDDKGVVLDAIVYT